MNKLRVIFMLATFLVSIQGQPAPTQAINNLPITTVVLPIQQQDEEPEERPAQLGENRGEIPEGSSQIWTYQGQAGDILTIKAEADNPANDAEDRTGLLDILLIVNAPDSTILAKADDIQTSIVTEAVIEGLQLPTDGTYKIEVLGLEKRGAGAYTLTFQADSSTPPEPTPTINPDWPTLTIENQLEETICYAYIWPVLAEEVGDEWLGTKQVIAPNDEHQWHVARDEYNIVLSDCYGDTLDQRSNFDATESSTVTISPLDGPAAQCAEGVQLFFDGKTAEAFPLLETGFAGREGATFAHPDDEGLCALALGLLRNRTGNRSGALIAYQVALSIFQASGNHELEGTTLSNIGNVYLNQGKYNEALLQYQQALLISREVGDRAGEGVTLNNIGGVYDNQGKYEEALLQYQQALFIIREVGDRAGEGRALNNIGSVYDNQGKYEEALLQYQQALFISREVSDRAGEGAILNNIGNVYLNQGKYKEALLQYQQALLISREVGDRAGEGTTLNNIGSVYGNQGKYEEALLQFQQVLLISREVGDRAGEGGTLNNIGNVYLNQGKFEEALLQFQQALLIRREVGDRAGEGGTLNNIGSVYDNQGKYEEALLQYQQALLILREVGDRAGEGETLNNIGEVYDNQGKYEEALLQYQQALLIRREVGDRAGEGTTLNNIGEVYRAQGRYEEALLQYQQALLISREVGDHASEGRTLNNIGSVYSNQGKYEQALLQYQQALLILREVSDRAGEGTTLNNIGAVYSNQGKYEKALLPFQQALLISREVGDRAGEGVTLNNIGGVYDNQGKYQEALLQYQQALLIRREVGGHAGEGTTLNNIGAVYGNQGKYEEALLQFQQALLIVREVGDRVGEGTTLSNIAFVYGQQYQALKAMVYYEQAMDVFEAVRATAGGEQERTSFIAQYAGLYQRAISLYYQQGQEEDAFLTSERGRARSFLDSLATGHVQLSDEDLQALIDQEREVYAERFAIRDELARVRAQNPLDTELVADLEAQLEAAEDEYSEVQADIEARGDGLAALVPGRSGVSTLVEVQALLDEETTLLSYWVLGEEGTLVFVITADEFTVVELPDATPDNLQTALSGLYDWLNKDNAHPKPLRNLHSWLVTPLAEHLKTPKVGLIPHQELHEVPFAALTPSDGERYFGEQYTLFRLPSASTFSHIQKNAANLLEATQPALIFGNPTTGEELFGPLVNAAKEAATVANLLGAPVYAEEEANEARLWSDAIGAPVVHLAAHGTYNEANPLYSAIHLAPQGDHDGRLETHEVYGLDLSSAEIVILSACQSNVGDASRGDDIVGLTRAFFFAKTPTLVTSLWNVDDAATEKLMSAFYRNWQDGMGKAEALQAAQAEVRANRNWASPFYWAAFVLNGDAGEVTSTPQEVPVPTQTASSEVVTAAATETTSPEAPNSAEEGSAWWLIVAIVGVLGVIVVGIGWRRRLSKG